MHLTAKRTISAILAALMMIFVLTSCQSSEETPDITRGNGSIEAPTAATTAATTGTTAATTGTTAAATTQKSNASSGSSNSSQSSQQTLANIAANSGQSVALVGSLINALGYNYDAKENVFYTELDSWQRSGNYIKHYDAIAAFGNMHYLTTRVDFNYDGRIFRPEMIFSKKGSETPAVCEKITAAGKNMSICVKTVDVLGNSSFSLIGR